MKNLILLLAMASLPAFASVSGHLGYTSDYMYRGVSQSQGANAFQGSVAIESNGFALELWASEVDFGTDTSLEYDFTGSYTFQATNKVHMSVGVIQYNYDKDIDDVEEWFVSMGNTLGTVKYFADIDNSETDLVQVFLNVPFIKVVDVKFEHGIFDKENDYTMLHVSKEFEKFNVGVLIGEEAKDGQFSDSASFWVQYKL